MKKILFVALVAVLAVACGKDRFQTTPQVEITSFGPDTVRVGGIFTLTADITDKEGDLQDSLFFVQKRYRNNTLLTNDTFFYKLNELNIPNKSKFEMELRSSHGVNRENEGIRFYSRQEAQNTQVTYGIIARDKAGNKSEYVESRRIILRPL